MASDLYAVCNKGHEFGNLGPAAILATFKRN